MFRVLAIPLAMLGLLIAAMLWSGGGSTQRAEFTFINRGDIFTLDINRMSYNQDLRLTYGIREGLFRLDPRTLKPMLAGVASYELSRDQKTWTFRLRPEARWSNGDPVRAADYAFSWRRMLEEPGQYSYLLYYIDKAKEYGEAYVAGRPMLWSEVGVAAPEDFTLVVRLKNPVPYLPDLVSFPPFYPRHERSMAAFRRYTDGDVMEPFVRYAKAAQGLSGRAAATAKELAARAGDTKANLDEAAVGAFVAAASSYEDSKATAEELLGALERFARLKPFGEAKASPTTAAGGPAVEVEFAKLTPAQKLAAMVARQFVRYVFDAQYTRPPHVVTNGPFQMTTWEFKRRIWLERSAYYWDRANVKSKNIELLISESPQHQLLMFDTGQVDWLTDVLGPQASELKALGRTELRTCPAFGTNYLTLMCRPELPAKLGGGKNPLADVRVRQALAMSVDRRFMVNTITRMGELPARTYVPPDGTMPEFTWKGGDGRGGPAEKRYTFGEMQALLRSPGGLSGPGPGLAHDVMEARRLLASAGYTNGEKFPVLPILYNTDNDARRQVAQALKDQWKRALNIDVEIQGVEGKIFSETVSRKDYWIATVAWFGDYADPSTFTDKYLSTSLENDAGWENAAFDELCDRATRELDRAKRFDLLAQAIHLIDSEAPIIPMYHYVNVSMSRDNVEGVTPNPKNLTFFKDVRVKR